MAKQTYGIIGYPVRHSLSPAMQNAAFKALGIAAEYFVIDVKPDRLTEFMDDIFCSRSGISGLNVTIPYKIKVKEYLEQKDSSFDRLRTNPESMPKESSSGRLGTNPESMPKDPSFDRLGTNPESMPKESSSGRLGTNPGPLLKGSLDEVAKKLGAVNTVKVTAGDVQGYNTDGAGFYRSLVEDLEFEPEGKTVFVLGAGGAASAIVMYLGTGPRRIYVFDVDKNKVEEMRIHYGKYYDARRFVAVRTPALRDEALEGTDLLINATPVGMKESDPSPVDSSFLHAGMHVYDLVYNRPVTELVKKASRARCHAVTGLGMLLCQGAIAFEIWTGQKAPIDVMKKALKEALGNG
jgi:shikimate dehydrogenase